MSRFLAIATALTVLGSPAFAEQDFANCSDGQKNAILTAQSQVPGMIDAALVFIAPGGLYERWFGVWTDERGALVRQNLETLKSQALIGAPAYNCASNETAECPGTTTFASISTGSSFEISVCPTFFKAPSVGANSQPGVLIHEFSHFHIGAQTDDHCYGAGLIGQCLDLAITQPDLAVRNADNYEYFVEEVP